MIRNKVFISFLPNPYVELAIPCLLSNNVLGCALFHLAVNLQLNFNITVIYVTLLLFFCDDVTHSTNAITRNIQHTARHSIITVTDGGELFTVCCAQHSFH
eukprot:TRINITY_DN1136_c0_g1_i1.p1 TRINITY_DN1136_c0_g1~~TRINITY_DN1136_c0_g1_i1.p1  ORF type:complete len:101 (+),score=2.56 TRINITY_DN1136_c0_g1_i1:349-651(+)